MPPFLSRSTLRAAGCEFQLGQFPLADEICARHCGNRPGNDPRPAAVNAAVNNRILLTTHTHTHVRVCGLERRSDAVSNKSRTAGWSAPHDPADGFNTRFRELLAEVATETLCECALARACACVCRVRACVCASVRRVYVRAGRCAPPPRGAGPPCLAGAG